MSKIGLKRADLYLFIIYLPYYERKRNCKNDSDRCVAYSLAIIIGVANIAESILIFHVVAFW